MPNQSGLLDQVFQALADQTRRDLVERLVRSPASVSELHAVMQHAQVIEACDLVRSEQTGRVRGASPPRSTALSVAGATHLERGRSGIMSEARHG